MPVTVHNGEPTQRVRSKSWTESRIEFLTNKRKQLKNDFEIRSANVEEELAQRKAELKAFSSKKK